MSFNIFIYPLVSSTFHEIVLLRVFPEKFNFSKKSESPLFAEFILVKWHSKKHNYKNK